MELILTKIHKRYRHTAAVTAAVLMLCVILIRGTMVTAFAAEPEYRTFSDLSGKTVAMLTGAPFEEVVRGYVPDVGDIQYFGGTPDMVLALKNHKIDAFFMNNAVGALLANNDPEIEIFPEPLGESTFGLAFEKNSPERAKWQAAFDNIPQETRQQLWDKWTGSDKSSKTIPEQDWPGSNGTVRAAVCDTVEPMSYVGDGGKLIGYDVETILLMAEQLDVHVEFTGMELASMMSEVESGKALIGAGSIVVNDERKKAVDFINYAPAQFVLVVRSADGAVQELSFTEKIKNSFTKTFITDDRWKMLLSGLGVTVLIAVCAGVLGTLLGFGLVFLRRRDNPVTNRIISVYSSLISGIPVVVILMVLYYVLFAAVDLSAVMVAIVGFALIFGARCFGVIWNAVGAVDGGQREAALALGYNESRTFRDVVLPQARRIFLPILQTQFVMLLKETSIAGYITVLDLTRAGDLIRSRTMEAFFPLMVIAAIYFLLTKLMTALVGLIDLHYDKARDARRIKGVD